VAPRARKETSLRSVDPRSVGKLECRAWETCYRRKWGACLIASVGRGSTRSARCSCGRTHRSWPRSSA